MKSLYNDCDDHLYVIESSCGHIKIGRARDVEARLRELSGTCPPSVTLSVIAAHNHGDWEAGLHELLGAHRVRNEWFTASAGIQIREWLRYASLEIVVRKLARRTGKTRGRKLMSPVDRRSKEWRAAQRRLQRGW